MGEDSAPADRNWQALVRHFDRAQRLSNAGSWEWDIETNRIIWSAQIYRMFGLRPFEFVPTYPAFLERVHADDRAFVEQRVSLAIAGEEPYDIEHRIVLPDGAVRHVHEIGEVQYADDGRPSRMLGAVQDVTDIRAVEAASRRNTEMLGAMLLLSPEAIIVTNEKGRILQFSAGAEVMYGYAAREAIGRSIEQLIPPAFRAEYKCLVEGSLEGGIKSMRLHERTPIYGLRKNGDQFPAEASLALLEIEEGFAITAIVRDLSERQASEARVNEARIRAEKASQAKSRFLANMSHEIRTPLNGVLGIAGALANTKLTNRQREMVALIETSGRALESLLGDILDISMIDEERVSLRAEPFDLVTSVREVVALFSASAAQRGVGLTAEIDASACARFLGDELRIRQVLSNLLSNAVKFTEEGEILVEVSTSAALRGESLIRFSVRDTGIGFAPDVAHQLFERFEQADSSITRRFGGTGLGLAICKSLVDRMGGVIWAWSEHGQGAEFVFEVRLTRAQEEQERASALFTPAAHRPRGRILLAEDNLINQLTIQMILEELPIDLVCVENGELAVEAAAAEAWDLILMDMQMPVMDGLTAIKRIRQHEASTDASRTPICVVTANAFPEHYQAADDAGADDFIPKPIVAATLLTLVRKRLDERRDVGTLPVSTSGREARDLSSVRRGRSM
ncbi:ATP-binding protein [Phenylobacterium sp.]|uniref:PAS domain-containing hybrid sensor histidine kinase/response regulator n=1 Tax=Phenylobacterium sp. TaxID=1871053 RepID=UPI003BA91592